MSDADIREWLREQGEEVGSRGTLPRAARDRYEAAHEPAYPEGMTDADFDVSAPGAPPADDKEVKPRSIATPKAARVGGFFGKKAAAGKGKKKQPRVPVDDLIAGVWRGLAGFARPMPATSRLLKVQAPIAGAILEDSVKGTVVDTVLQPFARTSKNAEAIAVLIGPPILVGVIEIEAMKDPESPKIQLLLPVLRELLLRMCKVGGPKMAEALAREREFEGEFGQTVDEMLSFLFAGTPDADASAEEENVRRAQEAMQAA